MTGSPIIFIGTFHLDPQTFGLIFALLGVSLIGGSQLNVWLTHRQQGRTIFAAALICQNFIALVIVLGTGPGWHGLLANIILLMLYLPFCRLAFPNAAAIALAPFSKNVGSATALLGFLQMGIGALASTGVGLSHSSDSLPIYAVMAATAFIGLAFLLANQKQARSRADVEIGA